MGLRRHELYETDWTSVKYSVGGSVPKIEKKALKNGAWLYLLQIFNTVIPLVTLPYITRILGPEQYGLFAIALNLQGYYQAIVEYGFDMSATRKVALEHPSNDVLNELYSRILCSRLLLMAPCIVLTLVYSILNYGHPEQCICLVILTASTIGYCFQLNWLFQGMQCMRFISIANMVGRLMSVVLIFSFVRSDADLFIYCLLHSVTPIAVGAISTVFAISQFDIRFQLVSFKDVCSELKEGWFVFTTQLSSKIFGAIGLTLLGVFSTSYEAGVYAAIQKIPAVILLAWAPISQVLYPISSQKIAESYSCGRFFVRRACRMILPLFVGVAVLLAIFARPVTVIAFGAEYASRYYWMYPLLAWMIVSIVNNFLGIQTLLAGGHDGEYSRCFNISVVITVIFNIVLIYFFKGDGACLAPLLSEVSLCLMLVATVGRLSKEEISSCVQDS